MFNPLLYIETPYNTPPETPEQLVSPDSFHTTLFQWEITYDNIPEAPHIPSTLTESDSDEYNHSHPMSPAPSSIVADSLASSITMFEEEIFEPQPERVQLVEGLLSDHQVLVQHIVNKICHNGMFLPILETNFTGPTYYGEQVEDLQELHHVYHKREQQEAYRLASIIDPAVNNRVWEEFFNNQLAQQLQQQGLPINKEIVTVQKAALPVVEEEDLLHSNNTSRVSLVSSHSAFIQEEREE